MVVAVWASIAAEWKGDESGMIESTFSKTIESNGLISENDRILLAVSGGADSVAMAHLFSGSMAAWSLDIILLHLNHQIRGEESDDDERFVSALADRLGVPVISEKKDVPRLAKRKGLSLEMAAREARYAFFRKAAKLTGISTVAVAHTLDDQAETVLLRLMRGSGLRGLGAMDYRAENDGLTVIRPLLDIRHAQLEEYLDGRNEDWREDPSNSDLGFTRNRVRHELIPYLENRFNPEIRETLHRTAGILRDEDQLMEGSIDAAWDECRKDGLKALDGTALDRFPRPVRYRVILRWLQGRGISPSDMDYNLVSRIDGMLRKSVGSKRIQVSGGTALKVRYQVLEVDQDVESAGSRIFRLPLRLPGETVLIEQGLRIVASFERGFEKSKGRVCGGLPAEAWINREKAGKAGIYVRSWAPGDRINIAGTEGSKKLQDIFVDEKIPRELRVGVPVLECRREIVWIPGFRVARGWEVTGSGSPSIHLFMERV